VNNNQLKDKYDVGRKSLQEATPTFKHWHGMKSEVRNIYCKPLKQGCMSSLSCWGKQGIKIG
jgi:hypothetical protein